MKVLIVTLRPQSVEVVGLPEHSNIATTPSDLYASSGLNSTRRRYDGKKFVVKLSMKSAVG
jgi:hypothetical protein